MDAIHPGYGFLSEREAFANACKENGITFVGPTAHQLNTFGDKTKVCRVLGMGLCRRTRSVSGRAFI